MEKDKIRNVAIIAHVDHGKTTLVDQMLKCSGTFRANQFVQDRVMDSNAIERERGITILAKNTSIRYGDYKINIVDTPGHADFGGEVERILKMVDGVLLVVDAFEGTMPQTRFVLSKALEFNHRVIIAVNKIDRPDARTPHIHDEVLELLMDLNAGDEQLNSPVVYCSAKQGIAVRDYKSPVSGMKDLFDLITEYIQPPSGDADKPLQMLVSSLDYNDYVGAIAIGRIDRGKITQNQQAVITDFYGERPAEKVKITNIYQFEGLTRIPVTEAVAGDIVCVSGVKNVTIGDTVCDAECPEPLPFVKISEPNVEMTFSVNDSPFAGREGKFVTSRHLRERLYKEALKDVSLRVRDTDSTEAFQVIGRGEMHLSILVENMRREGFEFQVSMPRVMFREINGVKCEPVDRLLVDTPEEYVGAVIGKISQRKGELLGMTALQSRIRLEFKVPSRGLFGYKSEFLTDTHGEGIMNIAFDRYEEYKGDIVRRNEGSLIAYEMGEAVTYGLYNAQERGTLFIGAGTPVYEGMIVGASTRAEDIVVNVCKRKQQTNMRASGSDETLRLNTPKKFSLDECMEFLAADELLEVTPASLRIRKSILSASSRLRNNSRAKA